MILPRRNHVDPFPGYPEEDPLEEAAVREGRPRLRVYRPREVQVVLGRGSVPEREVHLETCRADGVPLYTRRGGGCAVVLDPGCVILSLALPMGGFRNNRALFRRLTDWLVEGLARAGIQGVERRDVSDLAYEDRKVGGACLHRSKRVTTYGVSLLVSPDMEKVERYLPHPPREPSWRRGRPHREFMGALAPEAWPGTAGELARLLSKTLDGEEAWTHAFNRPLPAAGVPREKA